MLDIVDIMALDNWAVAWDKQLKHKAITGLAKLKTAMSLVQGM